MSRTPLKTKSRHVIPPLPSLRSHDSIDKENVDQNHNQMASIKLNKRNRKEVSTLDFTDKKIQPKRSYRSRVLRYGETMDSLFCFGRINIENEEYRSICKDIVFGNKSDDAKSWYKVLEIASENTSASDGANIIRLHRRATGRRFEHKSTSGDNHSNAISSDPNYELLIWLAFARVQCQYGSRSDAKQTYWNIQNKGIGERDAALYLATSKFEQDGGHIEKAIAILQKGVENEAKPLLSLQRALALLEVYEEVNEKMFVSSENSSPSSLNVPVKRTKERDLAIEIVDTQKNTDKGIFSVPPLPSSKANRPAVTKQKKVMKTTTQTSDFSHDVGNKNDDLLIVSTKIQGISELDEKRSSSPRNHDKNTNSRAMRKNECPGKKIGVCERSITPRFPNVSRGGDGTDSYDKKGRKDTLKLVNLGTNKISDSGDIIPASSHGEAFPVIQADDMNSISSGKLSSIKYQRSVRINRQKRNSCENIVDNDTEEKSPTHKYEESNRIKFSTRKESYSHKQPCQEIDDKRSQIIGDESCNSAAVKIEKGVDEQKPRVNTIKDISESKSLLTRCRLRSKTNNKKRAVGFVVDEISVKKSSGSPEEQLPRKRSCIRSLISKHNSLLSSGSDSWKSSSIHSEKSDDSTDTGPKGKNVDVSLNDSVSEALPKITKADLNYMLSWDPTSYRKGTEKDSDSSSSRKEESKGSMEKIEEESLDGSSISSFHKKENETKNSEDHNSASSVALSVHEKSQPTSSGENDQANQLSPTITPETYALIAKSNVDFLPLVSEDNILRVNNKNYAKLGVIGKGGSCKVYRALSKDCAVIAIKKVKLQGMDKKAIDGYANEIALLKRLRNNPAIIQMYDSEVDLSRKAIFLVMELGEVDLNHVLHQQAKLAGNDVKKSDHFKTALNMNFIRLTWQQMLNAVHCIHEERIIHGDLKPANFLFVRGALKLIDFGIAKAIQSDDTTNIYRDSQIGTLNYMSPEAILDTGSGGNKARMKLGRASDIWSLGCILYQMVYGRTPFAELHMIPKLQAIVNPNHAIKYPDIADEAAIDAIQLCLHRKAEKRPPIVGVNGLLNNHWFLNSKKRRPPSL